MPLILILYLSTLAVSFPMRRWIILNLVAIMLYVGLMAGYDFGLLTAYVPPVLNGFEISTRFALGIQAAYTAMLLLNGMVVSRRANWMQKAWFETDEQRHYLDRLHELTHLGLGPLGSKELYQTLADKIGQVLGADGSYITIWDDEQHKIVDGAAFGAYRESYDQVLAGAERPSMTESVCNARKPLIAENVHRSPYINPEIVAQTSIQSMLGVPMFGYPDKKFLGAALVAYNRPHQFSPEEIQRAEQIAELASLLMTRVRLYEETVHRAEMLEQFSIQVTDLTSDLKRTTLLPAIVEAARGLLKADRAALYLRDVTSGKMRCEYAIGLSDDFIEKFTHRAARLSNDHGVIPPILVPDVWQDSRTSPLQDLIIKEKFKAYATFSLQAAEGEIGALSVYWDLPRVISSEEVAVGRMFAARAANMLHNATLYAQVSEESLTDPLTGLPNRRFLSQRLEEEARRTFRYERPFALMMIDLDGFKNINDTFGHPIGDSVLKQLASGLNRAVRHTDFIARYGGDEFAIVLPEVDLIKALYVADKVCLTLAATDLHLPNETQRRLSACIGMAFFPSDTASVTELFTIADRRLYKAKRKAIGSVVYMDGGKDTKPLKPVQKPTE
jgi:diguanylate cyclase (GGDEF)-like protein